MTERYPTDWDIDSYCTDYESEEHWQLRRKFMEVHQDKFPEDRLVCLAQTFINIEFMGCKYPEDTMRQVAELSKDLAKAFRESRSTRLKRTFVGAAEAAEQRVKGRRIAQQQRQEQSSTSTTSFNNRQGNSRVSFVSGKEQRNQPNQAHQVDLFSGLPYGNFILQLTGGRNCLNTSAQRCKAKYEERATEKKVESYLNGIFIATSELENVKASKEDVFNKTLSILQKNCYSVKPNPSQDIIKIDKTDSKIVCGVIKEQSVSLEGLKIDDSNKGFKMMKKMGWTGGGLGSANQGREDPVNYLFKNNRQGLGNEATFNREYFKQMLNNYINSDDVRELRFEPTFTKDERAILHEIAGRLNLKSFARGSGDQRYLTISKKITSDENILTEILINKNQKYCNKYFVQVPESKIHLYPDHAQQLVLGN